MVGDAFTLGLVVVLGLTAAGQSECLGRPIRLLPLDQTSATVVGGPEDATLSRGWRISKTGLAGFTPPEPTTCVDECGRCDACVDGSCLPAADGDPCDDGDPCTGEDACVRGVCRGVPVHVEFSSAPDELAITKKDSLPVVVTPESSSGVVTFDTDAPEKLTVSGAAPALVLEAAWLCDEGHNPKVNVRATCEGKLLAEKPIEVLIPDGAVEAEPVQLLSDCGVIGRMSGAGDALSRYSLKVMSDGRDFRESGLEAEEVLANVQSGCEIPPVSLAPPTQGHAQLRGGTYSDFVGFCNSSPLGNCLLDADQVVTIAGCVVERNHLHAEIDSAGNVVDMSRVPLR